MGVYELFACNNGTSGPAGEYEVWSTIDYMLTVRSTTAYNMRPKRIPEQGVEPSEVFRR